MRDSGLVSVIIPTRERANLLRDAIVAIGTQGYQNIEIIVVDDASRDETWAVIEQARSDDRRIRGVRQEERRGPAAARNAGTRAARGEYLLFEDDDCRSYRQKIATLVRALEREPEAGYAYCWIRRPAHGSQTVTGTDGAWSIGTPGALIRRHVFDAIGGFDEELPRLEDFDLWTRILARWRAVEVPEVLYETILEGVGISASVERLLAASQHLMDKYSKADIPASHLSRMHRMVGGILLMNDRRAEGIRHFQRAVAIQTISPRSWIGLAAAFGGPRVYRLAATGLARLRSRAARRRSRSRG